MQMIVEEHSLDAHKSEIRRMQIEEFIFNVTRSGNKEEVRLAISVLFCFRRKLIKDEVFLEDVRIW